MTQQNDPVDIGYVVDILTGNPTIDRGFPTSSSSIQWQFCLDVERVEGTHTL